MNILYICTLVISLAITFAVSVETNYDGLVVVMAASFCIQLLGLLYLVVRRNIIAYIAMVGFLPFVPLGIIGVIGLSRMVDKHNAENFYKNLSSELGGELVSTEPSKTYYLDERQTNRFGLIGLVGTGVGIIFPLILVAAMVMVALYIIRAKMEVVQIFDKHVEIKKIPGANKLFIKKDDFTHFQHDESAIRYTYITDNGEKKSQEIPLMFIQEDKRQELVEQLQSVVHTSANYAEQTMEEVAQS